MRPRKMKLSDIRIDGGTQVRTRIDTAKVAEYAERMADGDVFRAVDVWFDGTDYWLSDGFHRWHAAARLGRETIPALVHQGTLEDAIWNSLTANRNNGLPLSREDKISAVKTALRHRFEESDRAIAKHVGVSHPMVAKYRSQLEKFPVDGQEGGRVGLDGKTRRLPQPPATATTYFDSDAVSDVPFEPKPENKPPAAATASEGASDIPQDTRPSLADQVGRDLEALNCDRAAGIREAFRRRGEVTHLMSQASSLKSTVLKAVEAEDPLFGELNVSQFQADMGNLYRSLRAIRPHAVCPYCGGDGCKACRRRGWVGEFVYGAAPREMKGQRP